VEKPKKQTWRQRLRNPSVRFVVTVLVVSLLVIGGALGPFVYSRGKVGYTALRKLEEVQFREPPETWIRPWLVNKIEIMRTAEMAHQWYPTDFVHEACAEEWIGILPNEKYQLAIRSACSDLRRIQADYAWACTGDGCAVPNEAKSELDEVERALNKAYEGALTPPTPQGPPS